MNIKASEMQKTNKQRILQYYCWIFHLFHILLKYSISVAKVEPGSTFSGKPCIFFAGAPWPHSNDQEEEFGTVGLNIS